MCFFSPFLNKFHNERTSGEVARKLQGSSGNLGRFGWGLCFSLIFFSLPFWFSLPFSFSRNSLRFWAFFPSFPRILGVRQAEEILAFLVVFLAVFQKGKEKKIRVSVPYTNPSSRATTPAATAGSCRHLQDLEPLPGSLVSTSRICDSQGASGRDPNPGPESTQKSQKMTRNGPPPTRKKKQTTLKKLFEGIFWVFSM